MVSQIVINILVKHALKIKSRCMFMFVFGKESWSVAIPRNV